MVQARVAGSPLTIALLHVDGLQGYRERRRHPYGDELLRRFTDRWSQALRRGDLLARSGTDEFGVLLPRLRADEARLVVERLRASSADLQSFSVGVAEWDGVETAEALRGRAESALHNSRRVGPGRLTILGTAQERAQTWSFLLPRIIAGREMDAIYQSIHRLDDYSVLGYEALARPAGFGLRSSVEDLFDAAKRLGYTRDLDWLCRRAAVHGANMLPAERTLFINVSIYALLDALHDVDQMLLLMRWAGRDPSTVVLEISERDAILDLERLLSVVAVYRAEGFRFAVDDAGEGQSLDALQCVNPEFIKIARTLVANLGSPETRAVVEAMVDLGASSGAVLIAEGLENESQVDEIRALGIEWGQGYVFGSPETGEQLASRDSSSVATRAVARAR